MAFIVPQIILLPLLQARINRLMERRVTLLRGLGDQLTELPEAEDDYRHSGLPVRLDRIYDNRLRTFLWKFGQKAIMNLLSAIAPLSLLLVGGIMVIAGETTIGVGVAFISGFARLSTPPRELSASYPSRSP